jgi:hypothetical protein
MDDTPSTNAGANLAPDDVVLRQQLAKLDNRTLKGTAGEAGYPRKLFVH